VFRGNRFRRSRAIGTTSSRRSAAATPIITAASLVTGHIKNETLQPVGSADETDSTTVASLGKRLLGDVELQRLSAASLVTGHTKTGTLQQIRCAAEPDSAIVAALVNCLPNGVLV
jgi:hypothetical protein